MTRHPNSEEQELRKEHLALYQKWNKDSAELEDNDIKEQTKMNAGGSQKFTRMVQRKNQTWGKIRELERSLIQSQFQTVCNAKANVGKDFLFHEAIPN
jgi:hypothetical protein